MDVIRNTPIPPEDVGRLAWDRPGPQRDSMRADAWVYDCAQHEHYDAEGRRREVVATVAPTDSGWSWRVEERHTESDGMQVYLAEGVSETEADAKFSAERTLGVLMGDGAWPEADDDHEAALVWELSRAVREALTCEVPPARARAVLERFLPNHAGQDTPDQHRDPGIKRLLQFG